MDGRMDGRINGWVDGWMDASCFVRCGRDSFRRSFRLPATAATTATATGNRAREGVPAHRGDQVGGRKWAGSSGGLSLCFFSCRCHQHPLPRPIASFSNFRLVFSSSTFLLQSSGNTSTRQSWAAAISGARHKITASVKKGLAGRKADCRAMRKQEYALHTSVDSCKKPRCLSKTTKPKASRSYTKALS